MPSESPTLVESSDGVRVAVHEIGGPAGPDAPVVVIAHANGLCALAYRPLAEHLAGAARCLAIDMRAHGSSVTPDGLDFAWRGFGDDVEAVLDQAVPAGATVHGVGHSLGGAALLLAASRRPGALRSLWLFEPIVPPAGGLPAENHRNPMADGAERRRDTFSSAEEAFANYAAKPPFAVLDPEALAGYVEGGFAPSPEGITLRCRPAWEAAIYRTAAGNGVWDVLESVTAPVAVAAGHGEGTFSPANFAGPTAERLPAGVLEPHPDLGHFGPLQDPPVMARAVRAWLASYEAGG
jgi:pimeloyl-ACP methyl ester carboxylesterase